MSGKGARAKRNRARAQAHQQEVARRRFVPGPRSPRQIRPAFWIKMQQAEAVPDAQLQELAERDPMVAAVLSAVDEIWLGGWSDGNQYVVTVRRHPVLGHVMCLSVRRTDRKAVHDWRDKQRIKNEIAGEDVDAFELYPMKKRTVDQANQYWLWCMPPGQEMPAGFDERIVVGENDPRFPMSRQRPFRDKAEREAI